MYVLLGRILSQKTVLIFPMNVPIGPIPALYELRAVEPPVPLLEQIGQLYGLIPGVPAQLSGAQRSALPAWKLLQLAYPCVSPEGQ
tara:strand:+ start:1574 stop:1831 length:258 start_codon:yes stop_codon:yes gene_type:complete